MQENKMVQSMRYMRYLLILSIVAGVLLSKSKWGVVVQVVIAAGTTYALYLIRNHNPRFNKAFIMTAILLVIHILSATQAKTVNLASLSNPVIGATAVAGIILMLVSLILTLMREKNIFYGIMEYNETEGYRHPKISTESKRLWKLTYIPFFVAIIFVLVMMISAILTMKNHPVGIMGSLLILVVVASVVVIIYSIYMTVKKYRYFHLCEMTFVHPPMGETEQVFGQDNTDDEPKTEGSKKLDDFY